MVVARIGAGAAVLVSSRVTTAVLSLQETTTLATPGAASRLALTVIGQAEQYMFRTARVIVCSPAKAGAEPDGLRAKSVAIRGFV